jgi:WbqC-like protein family
LIVAVHQPQYLPWLGYFDKIRRADMFCYLDDVQYKKNDWQNRNRIKTARGWQWLTVPVHYRFPQRINEVTINNAVNWKNKHLTTLVTNFNRAPFFREFVKLFEQVYSEDWKFLSDLNIALIERLKAAFGVGQAPAVKSSEFSLSKDPTDRLIDICRELKADTYLSGPDGVKYMDLDRFKQSGIQVVVQEFTHPVYPQLFNEFQSHMSVVDLLFNCGSKGIERLAEVNPLN